MEKFRVSYIVYRDMCKSSIQRGCFFLFRGNSGHVNTPEQYVLRALLIFLISYFYKLN